MNNGSVNTIPDEGRRDGDHLLMKAADTLQEAAERLRNTNLSMAGEEIRIILQDAESIIEELKAAGGPDLDKIESGCQKNIQSVEHLIQDHPIPSVLVATGAGVLLGMLLSGRR